jgi:hypothetical protein
MTSPGHTFPNVHARLRRFRTSPGAPSAETTLSIWLRGTAFRVRDETGRSYADLADDVQAARGFGNVPRTIEDLMDAKSRSRHPPGRPTELSGDLGTGRGEVYERGRPPWTIEATRLVPIATQLLTGGREARLDPVSTGTFLGRPSAEYEFAVTGEEDGIPYRSLVRWVVSTPYLLLREVRDDRAAALAVVTEVVELDEGSVTEADLHPAPESP